VRNIAARSCNHCSSGRAVSITYSECVFAALGFQHAMSMRYVIACGLWPVRVYHIFPHFLTKARFSKKKIVLYIKCVFWCPVQLLSETFLILLKNE
jgi:hypothetical protein